MLRAGRTNRNDHDPARLQLLQQRRGNVVDAAGDDDLVEGRRVLPAVIAVAASGRDRGIFAIALADQPIIDAACARRELGNDFDRMDPASQIGEQRRLEAGAGADFEHLVACANVERARHAAHGAGRRDRDTETDVEIVPHVGVLPVFGQDEFLARVTRKARLSAAVQRSLKLRSTL